MRHVVCFFGPPEGDDEDDDNVIDGGWSLT